jgi:predicted Co/Zn/Cd cation transporter (cation efflux family)
MSIKRIIRKIGDSSVFVWGSIGFMLVLIGVATNSMVVLFAGILALVSLFVFGMYFSISNSIKKRKNGNISNKKRET